MSSVLPYITWTKTLRSAVRPWRQTTESPYYVLSSAEKTVFAPKDRKRIRTGLIIYFPDAIYAKIKGYAPVNLDKGVDDWDEEFQPLKVASKIIGKSEYQGEIVLEVENLSDESVTIREGTSLASLEFRLGVTPTFLQGRDDVFPEPTSVPPPPPPPESDPPSSSDSERPHD